MEIKTTQQIKNDNWYTENDDIELNNKMAKKNNKDYQKRWVAVNDIIKDLKERGDRERKRCEIHGKIFTCL